MLFEFVWTGAIIPSGRDAGVRERFAFQMAVDYINDQPNVLPVTSLQLLSNVSNNGFEDFQNGKLDVDFRQMKSSK